MKHTPGPWKMHKWEGHVVGANDRFVAACNGYSDNFTDPVKLRDENVANARLIAKAPEMYAHLKAYWMQPLGASSVIKRDDDTKALLEEIDNGTE